jgi:hypothetical protein
MRTIANKCPMCGQVEIRQADGLWGLNATTDVCDDCEEVFEPPTVVVQHWKKIPTGDVWYFLTPDGVVHLFPNKGVYTRFAKKWFPHLVA